MEGMDTTLYFFGEEKNQEALMCFFVFGREEKSLAIFQEESKQAGEFLFFFLVQRVPEAFYSPCMIYEAAALQGPPLSNGHRSG